MFRLTQVQELLTYLDYEVKHEIMFRGSSFNDEIECKFCRFWTPVLSGQLFSDPYYLSQGNFD